MKLNPGIHIVMNSILSLKPRVLCVTTHDGWTTILVPSGGAALIAMRILIEMEPS